MSQESLGLIETIGLAAAIAAADAALKSANVTLVGYELSKGDGMTVVKLRGDVGAIKAAVAAAEAEAGRVGRVVATRVIARPALDLTKIIDTRETVGARRPDIASPEPVAEVPQEAPEEALATSATEVSADETPAAEVSVAEDTIEEAVSPEPAAQDAEAATQANSQLPRASVRPDKNHRRR